jgi:hypothetical protein
LLIFAAQMIKVKEIYRHNIYGVITALIFHIVVLLFLILSQLELRDPVPQDLLELDLSELNMKLPEPEKEKKVTPTEAAAIMQKIAGSNQQASNRAVNDAAKGADESGSPSSDPFFDKAYRNEIAAAKKLVSDVNHTLARKIPEIGDVPMPVDNTEGKTREEVKQSNFKGKSNIHYSLENRYHARLPIPVYLAEGGGEVIVDIVVGRDGSVLKAEPRQNPAISDMTVLAYAKQAAEKTWFNEDPKAPERQKGTITYLFLAQ